MEAHHLIPITMQDEMWDKYGINIDCLENIVSLCPNCHRAVHLADLSDKKEILTSLINKNIVELDKIGVSAEIIKIANNISDIEKK